jgi:hypothetical protein
MYGELPLTRTLDQGAQQTNLKQLSRAIDAKMSDGSWLMYPYPPQKNSSYVQAMMHARARGRRRLVFASIFYLRGTAW